MNADTMLVAGLSVNTLAVIVIAWRGGIMLGTAIEKLSTLEKEVLRLRDDVGEFAGLKDRVTLLEHL